MTKLLTPKLDIVFRCLFTEDTEILTDLLNAVLALSEKQRICSVEVKNPIILPEEITQKFIILDILAVDELDRRYDIEMQINKYFSYPKRTLYYLSKLYSGQLDAGEDYEMLRPVIGIHFLDYEAFSENSDFRFCFQLRDIRYPKLLFSNDISLYIFELPKFETLGKPDWRGNSLNEWLHFFNHAHEEDETMRIRYQNIAIHKAFSTLEKLSADDKTRHLAEIREKALKNEISMLGAAKREGMEIGKKEGIEIGKKEGIEFGKHEKAVETAKNLLTVGLLTFEQIARVTGLDMDEIQRLNEADSKAD